MSSLVNCSIVQVKCKRLEEKNLGGACTRMEDFEVLRSRDEIGGAESRLEEQSRN